MQSAIEMEEGGEKDVARGATCNYAAAGGCSGELLVSKNQILDMRFFFFCNFEPFRIGLRRVPSPLPLCCIPCYRLLREEFDPCLPKL